MATVTHEIDGKVGVVTLAKPPHNLMDDALIEDLVAAYRAVVAGGCRAILLRSATGEFRGQARIDKIAPGSLQGYWPEVNAVIPSGCLDASGVPDYNAIVEVIPSAQA